MLLYSKRFEIKDIVVVGAGISGATIAWFLKRKGVKNISLLDKGQSPPMGGSMAGGAFISPKIGKGSSLQTLTNSAFDFSWRFYKKYFNKHFHQSGVLRVPKDSMDSQKFPLYLPHNYKNFQIWHRERLKRVGLKDESDVSFFFPDAGDCNAKDLIGDMIKEIEFIQMEIEIIKYQNNLWHLFGKNGDIIKSKKVILALGHENNSLNIDLSYMGVKGVWGSRGDYEIKGGFDFSLHKDFSISSVRQGYVKIGATHIKSKNPCKVCDGKPLKTLEDKAMKLMGSVDINLIQIYCAMRSGSKDYFPLVGNIVDVYKTYQKNPKIVKGARVQPIHYKNLYIINGLGGRGFVFAPYLSNILSEYILYNKSVPSEICPDRLFIRWIRREGEEFFKKG